MDYNNIILEDKAGYIKYVVKQHYIEVYLKFDNDYLKLNNLKLYTYTISEKPKFIKKNEYICLIDYSNNEIKTLYSEYEGLLYPENNWHIYYFPIAKIYPCSEKDYQQVLYNLDNINMLQENIEKEQNQIRLNELEKEQIKKKLIAKQKKRELEKIATQELIDEGVLFPDANKRPPIPKELVDAIWNRDSGKCVYCGSTENLHLDHIIPFSKGGATCLENLQLLCEKCNLQKSNKIG